MTGHRDSGRGNQIEPQFPIHDLDDILRNMRGQLRNISIKAHAGLLYWVNDAEIEAKMSALRVKLELMLNEIFGADALLNEVLRESPRPFPEDLDQAETWVKGYDSPEDLGREEPWPPSAPQRPAKSRDQA